jgi:hypothetical protein
MAERHVIVRKSIKAFAEGMERRLRWANRKGGPVMEGDIPHHRQMSFEALREGARRNLSHFDPHQPQPSIEEDERQAADVANYLVFYLEKERAEA